MSRPKAQISGKTARVVRLGARSSALPRRRVPRRSFLRTMSAPYREISRLPRGSLAVPFQASALRPWRPRRKHRPAGALRMPSSFPTTQIASLLRFQAGPSCPWHAPPPPSATSNTCVAAPLGPSRLLASSPLPETGVQPFRSPRVASIHEYLCMYVCMYKRGHHHTRPPTTSPHLIRRGLGYTYIHMPTNNCRVPASQARTSSCVRVCACLLLIVWQCSPMHV